MKRFSLIGLCLSVLFQIAVCVADVAPPVLGITISGTVMDDPYPMKRASLPIQGAKVELWVSRLIVYQAQSPSVIIPIQPWQLVDSTRTSLQGVFAFKGNSSMSYQIRVSHPNYNNRTISLSPAKDTSLTILLVAKSSKARVTGTVWKACTGTGPCIASGVPGCTVTVTSTVPAESFQTVTLANGQYNFDSIPVYQNGGRITVTARKAGFSSQSVDTSIRNMMTTAVDFTLTEIVISSKDTVIVTPAKPTSKDVLTFKLRLFYHCCVTKYLNNAVSVSDSSIYLSYTYDDSQCALVNCLVAGSETSFTGGPLKAGRYTIYKAETPYCPPGALCPMIKIAPVRVGSVTILPGVNALPFSGTKAISLRNGIAVFGTSVTATVAKSGPATIAVFDLRGALLGEVYKGLLPSGTTAFNLGPISSKARGTVIVRLTANGIDEAVKMTTMAR
jgi:hypothetical protein